MAEIKSFSFAAVLHIKDFIYLHKIIVINFELAYLLFANVWGDF